MKTFHLALLFLLLPFNFILSQEKIDIEGAIVIANSEEINPSPGTIRYNPTTCDFEGWNGLFWASLTGYDLGSVSDIDGNTYKTIKIGTQEWMAENLRTSHYKNADPIPNVADSIQWGIQVDGAYCWYDNDSSFDQPFGKLYNWYAVDDSRGICPVGWNVPTDLQWTTLTNFLGGVNVAGGEMKQIDTLNWMSPNQGAINKSGFTGLPSGVRGLLGSFNLMGYWGDFWSKTEATSDHGFFRRLEHINDNVTRSLLHKRHGFSVRCVR